MKHEDFDNEIGALFEEDSVLAKAVINLQKRRERISDEDKKIENENLTEKSEDKDNKSDLEEKSNYSDASDATLSASDSYDFSATVEAEEVDNADLSLLETEALAVNPADVIPYSDESAISEVEPKQKKKKLFGKSEKKSAEVIKLLDFVTNDNTVNTAKSTEHPAQDDEKNFDENNTLDAITVSDDSEAVSLAESIDEEAVAILPEPDEETVLPDSAEPNDTDVIDENDITHLNTEDSADSIPLVFDESESLFLTHFDNSAHQIESEADSVSETETAATTKSDVSDISAEEKIENISDDSNGFSEPKVKTSEKSRFIDGIFDFVELFIFSLAAVLLITTFFFRHSVVEGSSMEQTLFNGEHIIISKLFYKPERGDIIVCEDYSTNLRKPIVKRIIAVPGDTVVFLNTGTDTTVFVNGEELDEDYIYLDGADFTPSGVWTVGEDEVFVMGDHRNNSTDSRAIGPVKIDSIIGKALLRFYPFDTFGRIE